MKPYDSIDEFEAIRALALNDVTAAAAQLAFQGHLDAHTLVRIYFGPPGTGKTLHAVQQAVLAVDPNFAQRDDFSACFRRMNDLHDRIAFLTFHPSLQYEDAVESIRPRLAQEAERDADDDDPEPGGDIRYVRYEGPIMRLAGEALRHPELPYVIVIDEINRGDVSRILGPLISAIEADKRLGAEFPIGFERQYPLDGDLDTRAFLPANLHIIGTMNSADRNIALVDHALRRRFEFVLIPPDPEKLAQTTDADPLNVRQLLRVINERLAYLLDDDHRIGHGYLMSATTNLDVVGIFATKILPLLFEYFYGDEALIALVLGDRVDDASNVLTVSAQSDTFEGIFGITPEAAHAYGLRATRDRVSARVDRRFWNPDRIPPGPDDDTYAVGALRSVYELANQVPAADGANARGATEPGAELEPGE